MCFPVYPLCPGCKGKAYSPYKNAEHFKIKHCILVTDGDEAPAIHSHLGLPESTAGNPSPVPEELRYYEVDPDEKRGVCNDCIHREEARKRKRDKSRLWRWDEKNSKAAALYQKNKREAKKIQQQQKTQSGTASSRQGTASTTFNEPLQGEGGLYRLCRPVSMRVSNQEIVQKSLRGVGLGAQMSSQVSDIHKQPRMLKDKKMTQKNAVTATKELPSLNQVTSSTLPSRPKDLRSNHAGKTRSTNQTVQASSSNQATRSTTSKALDEQTLNKRKQSKISRKIMVQSPASKATSVKRSTVAPAARTTTKSSRCSTPKVPILLKSKSASSKGLSGIVRGRNPVSTGTSMTSCSTSRSTPSAKTASSGATALSSPLRAPSPASKSKPTQKFQLNTSGNAGAKATKKKPRKLEIRTK